MKIAYGNEVIVIAGLLSLDRADITLLKTRHLLLVCMPHELRHLLGIGNQHRTMID
jgi:hypothetical protein